MAASELEHIKSLMQGGEFETALPLLEDITRKEPANWRAFSFLGITYARTDRLEKAIGAFRRAVQINPKVPSVRYNLGQACECAGVPLEALHEYEEAVRLDPNYEIATKAYLNLRQKMDAQSREDR